MERLVIFTMRYRVVCVQFDYQFCCWCRCDLLLQSLKRWTSFEAVKQRTFDLLTHYLSVARIRPLWKHRYITHAVKVFFSWTKNRDKRNCRNFIERGRCERKCRLPFKWFVSRLLWFSAFYSLFCDIKQMKGLSKI